MRFIRFALIIAGFFLQSCTSTTHIFSHPAGAKVYVNEEYLGKTPCVYSDGKFSFSTTTITLRKEGYKNLHPTLTRNETVKPGLVGASLAGVFILKLIGGGPMSLVALMPLPWGMGYKTAHTYELDTISNDRIPQH